MIGVDLSEGMLERARGKASVLPVEFQHMDAERLEFDDATFDFALCGFAIFFMPNMVHCVQEVHRVLRPGGRLAFSTWITQAFEPMAEMTRTCFERYGIPRVPPPAEPWMACTEPWHLLTLLEKGSFHERQVVPEPSGYFIEPEDWWAFMWGTPIRHRLSELPPEVLEPFKREILTQVRSLQDERGAWVDASALIGTGIRPHEQI